MIRRGRVGLVLALLGGALGAGARPQLPTPGIVVEKVDQGYAGEKPAILPGDILVSWERRPNPPANPSGQNGTFRTPFDVRETCIHQAPRARTISLTLVRNGRRMTASLSELSWDIETRPAFDGARLARYEDGARWIESGDLAKGTDAWRSLAHELTSSGDPLSAAWVWQHIAMKEAAAKRVDAAAASMDLAIAAARAANREDVEAQLWTFKGGDILSAAKRFKDGEVALRKALAIREKEEPDGLGVAASLNDLNWVSEPRGADYEADQTRALRIAQRLAPGSAQEADSLGSLGTVTTWRGDGTAGLDMIRRSLAIFEALDPNSRPTVFALNSLCATGSENGDLATADSYCARLLAAARRRPAAEQPNWIALGYHNMAFIAQDRGDLETAATLLRKALAIREATAPGSRAHGANLEHLGLVEMRRGNLEEAEKLIRGASPIQEAVAQLNSPHKSNILAHLAEINFRRGDLSAALMQLREAAALWDPLAPDGPTASNIYDDIGQVLAQLGETREAEAQFRRALRNRRRSSGVATRLTAESSHNLGMLLWKTGRLAEAEGELRRSIEDLEAQQAKLGGSAESQSSFTAEFADYYKDYLRLLVELKRQDDAFLLLERFRAGSFRRTLAQRDITAPEEVPESLERERRSTNSEYDRLQHEIEELNPTTQAGQIEAAVARLGELRQQQSEIAEKIRKASPRYASLRYPQPFDVAAARAALEPGTLLLSYAVGREKSYLFVLSAAKDALSVYELAAGEKELRAAVDAFRRLIQWNKPDSEAATRSRALYRLLLEPVQERIARAERLLIVADGPLLKLPWAALIRDVPGGRAQFLAEWKPIHTAPSVTVYAELEKTRMHHADDLSIVVAAFGDPTYPPMGRRHPSALRTASVAGASDNGAADPEIGDAVEVEDPQLRSVARGGFDFAPLPKSRTEVTRIAALYSPRAATYLGADATEENAASVGRDVPLIHFACHAIVNERFPLDSALVLTIPQKPTEGQGNGLLQAWEIFERVRIDADLVTLSACDSGLGKEMAGEGLIGLTRAFQYAGARSVLASLWKVEDKSTFRLMLPLSFALISGLQVEAGGRACILPAANVEQTARLPRAEIRSVENRDTVLLSGEVFSLVSLAGVLGLGESRPTENEASQQIVLLRASDKRIAFAVDQVVGVQEVLVKPLGSQLSRVRNVAGATVLGNGCVVPILNINDLVRSALLSPSRGELRSEQGARSRPRRLSVLVAEDSITSRTLLKNILESSGFQVTTAFDGADALVQLKTGSFDIVISDVEMPRLDGFGLTAAIRGDSRWAALPVVLVTGLESRADRERGIEVGANAYVVKSSFDQSSLIEVIQKLT